ncbi:hypothetical protein B0H14DRAFT_2568217 [Mycena olivaceomarginata]|nr:hypothetical protein B0H14DRAFT_2568217 [Mycena olivaceomarginata]
MIAKASVLAATLLFVAGAQAQCGNSGVGIGAEQLCSFSGKNVICGELFGFITKRKFLDASRPAAVRLVILPKPLLALTRPLLAGDQAAVKHDLSVLPGDLCGDYEGTPGFGGAHTTCNGNTVVRVTPPNSGEYTRCDSANIVTGVRNTPLPVLGPADSDYRVSFLPEPSTSAATRTRYAVQKGGDRLPLLSFTRLSAFTTAISRSALRIQIALLGVLPVGRSTVRPFVRSLGEQARLTVTQPGLRV